MEIVSYTQAFNRILKASSIMEQKVRKFLRPHGLTPLQYHILGLLATSYPFAKSPTELKKELVISSPDVTRILDRLVLKEWVERKTCDHNRRKVDVRINPKGKEKYDLIHTGLKNEIDSFLSDRMTEEDMHQLVTLISKIDQPNHLTQ